MPIIVKKVCPYCQKKFSVTIKYPSQASSVKKHCCRSHARKASLENCGGWLDVELNTLIALVGFRQKPQIIKDWNDIARQNGWIERSLEAIKTKLDRECRARGIHSKKATHDNWSLRELTRQLDLPLDRAEAWRDNGMQCKKISFYLFTTRMWLKSFAVKNPSQFWGIDPKKLGKVLKDNKLALEICEVAGQPTTGRAITVIRLDTGDVYRSARSAACTLNPTGWQGLKSNILKTCLRDTPMRNGMDWARIDYPVYWVPLMYREEFNQVAGRLLYQIHGELKDTGGYQKTSCLIVAGRLAVQITLIIFRRRFKDNALGVESRSIPELADFWREKFLGYITNYIGLSIQSGWKALLSKIKSASYRYMSYLTKEIDRQSLFQHTEDFAVYFINEAIRYFQQKSYIPYNYKPQTELEIADLYGYVEGSFWAQIELAKETKYPLGHLKMLAYYKKHLHLSTSEFNESYMSPQMESSSTSANYGEILNKLLTYIQSRISVAQFQQYKLYIDLKIEECSDTEIASVMELPLGKLSQLKERLTEYAKEFLTCQKAV